jgi:hypothetical protein
MLHSPTRYPPGTSAVVRRRSGDRHTRWTVASIIGIPLPGYRRVLRACDRQTRDYKVDNLYPLDHEPPPGYTIFGL